MKKSLGKGSGWITDLVIDDNINISKHILYAGSRYAKLPKVLGHPGKGLISIQKLMIMNVSNGVQLDSHILLIITQQELQKLTNILEKNLILKTKNFRSN